MIPLQENPVDFQTRNQANIKVILFGLAFNLQSIIAIVVVSCLIFFKKSFISVATNI